MGAMDEAGFTKIQQEILVVMFQSLDVLIGNTMRQAEGGHTMLIALRNLLTRKGTVTPEEWDEAVSTLQAERKILMGLDPEVQEAIAQIREVYPWFGTDKPRPA